jgi:photosystem II stability/assembly factor-like uncharacterized protein
MSTWWHIGVLCAIAACGHTGRSVDSSLHEEKTCALTAVAFGDDRHGFVADRCGRLFQTSDAGKSWQRSIAAGLSLGKSPERYGDWTWIAKLLFPSRRVGYAHVEPNAAVYQTIDGGSSWRRVTEASEEWPYTIARAGNTIWACGPARTVLRSADEGATWTKTGSPFDSDDACSSISFASEQDGWAGGVLGSLFETADGGRSWHKLTSPGGDTAVQVFRWSHDLGWILAGDQLFRTSDAGANWAGIGRLDDRLGELVVVGEGDRRLLSAKAARRLEDAIPVFSPRVQIVSDGSRAAGAVALRDARLVEYYAPGDAVRATPIVIPSGESKRDRLAGEDRVTSSRWLGWSSTNIYQSEDGGTSWFVVGRTPPATRRLHFVDALSGFAESRRGWYRSTDGGRTWRASDHPEWEQYQLDRAAGRQVKSPMDCVSTTGVGAITIELAFSGCNTASVLTVNKNLTIEWGSDGSGGIKGTVSSNRSAAKQFAQTLSAEQARGLARRIVAAAEHRGATPGACNPGLETDVQVKWRCNAGPARTVEFRTDECARSATLFEVGEDIIADAAKAAHAPE